MASVYGFILAVVRSVTLTVTMVRLVQIAVNRGWRADDALKEVSSTAAEWHYYGHQDRNHHVYGWRNNGCHLLPTRTELRAILFPRLPFGE
jgi:hypothetical protein